MDDEPRFCMVPAVYGLNLTQLFYNSSGLNSDFLFINWLMLHLQLFTGFYQSAFSSNENLHLCF